MASSTATPPESFISKKRKILGQLSVPVSEYHDFSPKGSVDEGIRDLIDEINQMERCVTTSSCAGRVSVFLEGKKGIPNGHSETGEDGKDGEVQTRAGVGGKGGGGKWLYVSHNPLDWRERETGLTELLGMNAASSEELQTHGIDQPGEERWVHFKFEPMVSYPLHTLEDY